MLIWILIYIVLSVFGNAVQHFQAFQYFGPEGKIVIELPIFVEVNAVRPCNTFGVFKEVVCFYSFDLAGSLEL